MIPEDTIARVRESIDLVELVREQVPGLKKSGRNFQARCPFHQERTPSFNVNPEMGVFKCFGCGKGGDAFKFLMETEGLTYPEAIRKLAQRVGIMIEEAQGEAVSAEAKAKQALYGLMEEAAGFYHRVLMESSEAEQARAYLSKRGLTSETLQKFSVGFAPASGSALRDAAQKKGYGLESLDRAGLIRTKEGTGRTYDHFWNRIVFPIWDTQGRIIAFGGRAMGDAMPKYINSPETPIYSKSRHLYGLFQGMATLRKARHAIVLEGYMDVATCHQFGIDKAVATLGTALTDEHVRLLRRYADHVTLLFDPDAAGAQAALRGGELLVSEGFTVDVVVLPDDVDADEILVAKGREALDAYLEKATPFMDYFLARVMDRHPGLTPEAKLAVAREVLPLVKKIKDPLLQDEHLGRVAAALRADKAILAQQMRRQRGDAELAPARTTAPAANAARKPGAVLSLEEEIFLLAIHYPTDEVYQALVELPWLDPRCAEAWHALSPQIRRGAVNVSEVLGTLSEPAQQWLTQLALEQRTYPHPEAVLGGLVGALHRQREGVELQQLKQDIDRMIEGKTPMDTRKIQTYNDLSRRLKGSRPSREAPLHG
jgi:DNA primase